MEKPRPDTDAAGREPHDVTLDHSEWIKLIEVGIALGVDWRSLIEGIGRVVREKKAEEMNSLHNPIVCG